MTLRFQRSLIEDDFLFAVQHGKLTQKERHLGLWYLNAGNWNLQGVVGMPTDLLKKLMDASALLKIDSVPTVTTGEPSKSVERSPAVPSAVVTYGFSKPEA